MFSPEGPVTTHTSPLLTAKCTSAPLGKVSCRSNRYWLFASPMLRVKSVFSSPVATGMPLRKRTMSMLFSLVSLAPACTPPA